jgi:hypothetical protein
MGGMSDPPEDDEPPSVEDLLAAFPSTLRWTAWSDRTFAVRGRRSHPRRHACRTGRASLRDGHAATSAAKGSVMADPAGLRPARRRDWLLLGAMVVVFLMIGECWHAYRTGKERLARMRARPMGTCDAGPPTAFAVTAEPSQPARADRPPASSTSDTPHTGSSPERTGTTSTPEP